MKTKSRSRKITKTEGDQALWNMSPLEKKMSNMDDYLNEDLIYWIEVKCEELNGPVVKIKELSETARVYLRDGKTKELKEIIEEMLNILNNMLDR